MSTEFIHIDPNKLVCRPQVRESSGFSDSDIAELAQGITAVNGVLQPLLVRRDGDSLVLIDGERRLKAALLAGILSVPIIIDSSGLSEAEVLQQQLVLDATRVNLNAAERAKAINRLVMETGWSAAQVAAKLGWSQAQISKLRSLCLLPDEVLSQVAAGQLPASTAYEIAKVDDPAKRTALAREAAATKMTRKHVIERITGRVARQPARVAAPRQRVVLPIGDRRSITIASPELNHSAIVSALQALLEKVRAALASGQSLPELATALRRQQKGGTP